MGEKTSFSTDFCHWVFIHKLLKTVQVFIRSDADLIRCLRDESGHNGVGHNNFTVNVCSFIEGIHNIGVFGYFFFDDLVFIADVFNSEKIDGRKQVRLDVYFTAVGLIDIPGEKELIEMMREIQSAKSA